MSQNIAMIFPGQGSQSIGMGQLFYEHSALAKQMFERASERIDTDMCSLLFEPNEQINQTAYTQSAILLVSTIAFKLFNQKCQISPKYLLGHSLGELSALCASGAIDYLDGIELVHSRGELMQEACRGIDASMMVVLGLSDESVQEICRNARNRDNMQVWAANYNLAGQIVVAGIRSDLARVESIFKEAGAKRAMLLNMSVASHCPLLSSAQAPFKKLLQSLNMGEFKTPIVSNVTARTYRSSQQAIELLTEQLTHPVKYRESIEFISSDTDICIEFGNGKVLAGLNRKINKDLKTINVYDPESLEAAVSALS